MKITPEFMVNFLDLPGDSAIVGCRFDERGLIEFFVENSEFLDVCNGDIAPTVEPQYTRTHFEARAKFVSWGMRK